VSDYVLIDGDQANFMPAFGAATVAVQPGDLSASGPANAVGKKICVDGDEGSVSVSGCSYMTPQYSIPGTGTLKIDSLASDQIATRCKTGGKKVLLVGSTFTAKFEVQSPAQQPNGSAPPIPDATPSYSGSGSFITNNSRTKAT
jgi:hypothetical protein